MISETTERRQSFRLPLTMECAINIPDCGLFRCKTRDISEEGVFVVGDMKGLVPDSQVTLAVRFARDGRMQVQQFRAVVRHLSATGVGLYLEGAQVLLQMAMARRAQAGVLGALQ
jgi:c-di-GMP-binding flagellar brake protein YcgR